MEGAVDVVTRDRLDEVRAPIGEAKGLPNAFYTDTDVSEAEKRVLFAESWACIGFGKDVADPRTAKPFDFLGQPLLMVRDRDGDPPA